MNSRQFCFFLDGLLKGIPPAEGMSEYQLGVLRENLNSVFEHEIDPSMGSPEHQAELDEAHTPFNPSRPSRDFILKC